MPTEKPDDVQTLTFAVGRLAGAVEALTSRLNRTDDFIDSHFKELNQKFDTHMPVLTERLTILETQRGRIAIPASGLGAVVGALVGAFTTHFLGK